MINPDFSVRTAEPMTDAERKKWCKAMVDDFTERGSIGLRVSVDYGADPKIVVVDGWLEHVDGEDVPPPNWHF